MTSAYHVGVNVLPIQGKKDAPQTFRGSYEKVEEFLRSMDKLYACYQVTSDQDQVDAILPYCSTKVKDFIQTSSSFLTPDWNELKEDIMDYYDAEQASCKYAPKDIMEFSKE
jgi:oligoendopeptidase F